MRRRIPSKHGAREDSRRILTELERRLLAVSREEHTESGAHKMVVESWEVWAQTAKIRTKVPPAQGLLLLEQAANGLGASSSMLPWGS